MILFCPLALMLQLFFKYFKLTSTQLCKIRNQNWTFIFIQLVVYLKSKMLTQSKTALILQYMYILQLKQIIKNIPEYITRELHPNVDICPGPSLRLTLSPSECSPPTSRRWRRSRVPRPGEARCHLGRCCLSPGVLLLLRL